MTCVKEDMRGGAEKKGVEYNIMTRSREDSFLWG